MEYLRAFVLGGALCVIAQILIDRTRLTAARILVGFVAAGVLLSGAGIYGYLVDFGGCGATVPLSGFGHLIAEGVKEAIEKDGAAGILTGPLCAASGGTSAALLFGLAAALIFKDKKQK